MLALHCLEVLTLIVFDESNRVAAQQLIVHPKRGVGDFPTTSSAHLDNILPTMIRTVKISHRSKILGYCPKRLACFGSSTRFRKRKVVGK